MFLNYLEVFSCLKRVLMMVSSSTQWKLIQFAYPRIRITEWKKLVYKMSSGEAVKCEFCKCHFSFSMDILYSRWVLCPECLCPHSVDVLPGQLINNPLTPKAFAKGSKANIIDTGCPETYRAHEIVECGCCRSELKCYLPSLHTPTNCPCCGFIITRRYYQTREMSMWGEYLKLVPEVVNESKYSLNEWSVTTICGYCKRDCTFNSESEFFVRTETTDGEEEVCLYGICMECTARLLLQKYDGIDNRSDRLNDEVKYCDEYIPAIVLYRALDSSKNATKSKCIIC